MDVAVGSSHKYLACRSIVKKIRDIFSASLQKVLLLDPPRITILFQKNFYLDKFRPLPVK